jgi:hypothetical protein
MQTLPMNQDAQNLNPFAAQQKVSRPPVFVVPPKLTELKDIPVKTQEDMEAQYGENVNGICEDHEKLI